MQLVAILVIVAKCIPILAEVKKEENNILDAKNLEGKVTSHSKAVILGNLCNPMRTVCPQNEAEKGASNAHKSRKGG